MINSRNYYLKLEKGGIWELLKISNEYESLIAMGMEIKLIYNEITKVVDDSGQIIWHAKGAPFITKDAH